MSLQWARLARDEAPVVIRCYEEKKEEIKEEEKINEGAPVIKTLAQYETEQKS